MDIRVFTKILKEPHFTDYQKLRRYSQRIARMLKHPSFSLSNNPKFQARFRVMSFVLAKNVYNLIKALYW